MSASPFAEYLTAKDVAALVGLHVRTVAPHITKRSLRPVAQRLVPRHLFERDEVERWASETRFYRRGRRG